MASAAGPAYIIPSIPKTAKNEKQRYQEENLTGEGEQHSLTGFPIAAKKLDDNNCTPFKRTINRKIRINLTANSK